MHAHARTHTHTHAHTHAHTHTNYLAQCFKYFGKGVREE